MLVVFDEDINTNTALIITVVLVLKILSTPDSQLTMTLQVKRDTQVGKHQLVWIGLVHTRYGVPQRVPVLDVLASRVDKLVFLVCNDDIQGGLAAWMAPPAAVVGFVWRATEIRAQLYARLFFIWEVAILFTE